MIITEDYVSFETAKLLKEKGFDKYPLFPCYKEDDSKLFIDIPTTLDTINFRFIPAPTLQMAMKWLREVHNLLVVVDRNEDCYVWQLEDNKTGLSPEKTKMTIGENNSYEQACEAAIKYCIENLI